MYEGHLVSYFCALKEDEFWGMIVNSDKNIKSNDAGLERNDLNNKKLNETKNFHKIGK